MPENITFESVGVVAYVLVGQVLRRTLLQSRRRSGRAEARKDIGVAERVASEVDAFSCASRRKRPTALFPHLRSSLLLDWPAIAQLSSLIPGRYNITCTTICMP